MSRVGVWIVGARGAMATTAALGARAIARGLAGDRGLVTAMTELKPLPLVPFSQLVFGGWDVVPTGLVEHAHALATEDRAIPVALVTALEDDLRAIDARIRPGIVARGTAKLAATVERLGNDLDSFRQAERLDSLVVVNLASTEPPVTLGPGHRTIEGFRRLVAGNARARVTPSMLYAYAALDRGYPFVNFTPSPALAPPGLQALGAKHAVPFYGSDGKTGETLMKTVLAALFRYRNLEVLSWEGFNILGGGDGRVLSDPRNKGSKIRSKSGVLGAALGYSPHSTVGIEYVPSLGTWKTAWDFIHFRGFLGTKMSAQFIWQGCDSILAAPLVLDLVRLTEFAQRSGEAGPMTHLACFFKDPLGVNVHAFTEQFRMLTDYVARHTSRKRPTARKSPGA